MVILRAECKNVYMESEEVAAYNKPNRKQEEGYHEKETD